ncbi:hypothetical protein H1X87_16430 [Vibrio parahaemolyticus]|uniref:Uncharacterized protein n=1 Tax=Vibrio ichthyoenteri ATCC 700023 TaxID=870968 RepID=F9S2X2_9VIBR|nr:MULTISPECIES: hypothetical protein [Vibrio]EGU38795.1 hypothetical protein VII00023_14976 [Vibrio ichthyoenteri ATCC 700023]MBC8662969.1 hypothetical protein [Vibrio parahaemolyticus]WMO05487.1 hypothetical protein NI378_02935 [Vibrio parahaemolyticus]
MAKDNASALETGLFDELRSGVNSLIDKMESEQSKINKAMFEALDMNQRSVFLKSLKEQGVKAKRMEKITGKEQSTISRTLNRK